MPVCNPEPSACSSHESIVSRLCRDDWMRTLYNGCYCFNSHFAAYVKEFAKRYSDGEISQDALEEELSSLENELSCINSLRQEKKAAIDDAAVSLSEIQSDYFNSPVVGKIVKDAFFDMDALIPGDCLDQYRDMCSIRDGLYGKYRDCVKDLVSKTAEYDRVMDSTKCRPFELKNRISRIRKSMQVHSFHVKDIVSDADHICEILLLPEMTERLVALCLSILHNAKMNDAVPMDEYTRTQIADGICEKLSTFCHGYDIVAGCYAPCDSGIALRSDDKIKKTIYNGYYMTINGFVQKTYYSVMAEKRSSFSIDEICDEDGNLMEPKSLQESTQLSTKSTSYGSYDIMKEAGMVSYWKKCLDFLKEKISLIARDIQEMIPELYCGAIMRCKKIYGSSGVSGAVERIFDCIDFELSNGRMVGMKMRHIVLDAFGGAFSVNEWKTLAKIVSEVITKWMRNFFLQQYIAMYGVTEMNYAEAFPNEAFSSVFGF